MKGLSRQNRIFPLLAFLLMGLFLAGCQKSAPQREEPPVSLKDGFLLMEQNRLDEAEAIFKGNLRKNPDDPEACFGMAEIFYRRGNNTEEAERLLKRSVEINPGNPKAHNRLGMIIYQQGRSNEAEEQFLLTLKADPDFAPALDNMGFCCFYKGDDKEALKYFDRAIKADPDFADSHLGRGMVLARTGKTDEALKEFDRAIELKKDYPDPYFERGIIRTDRFELNHAIEDFSEAVRLKPLWISPLFERGMIYYHQGRFREAGRDFEKALTVNAPSGDSRGRKTDLTGHLEIMRGLCLYHLKEPGSDLFLRKGIESLKTEPVGDKSYDGRGFAHYLLGDLPEAERIFRTDNEMLHREYGLALVLLKTDREPEALRILIKASRKLPPLWEKKDVQKLIESQKN